MWFPTPPESRNKSIELRAKPADFDVESVRSKDEMNLSLYCDNIYRFSFSERCWIPQSILSFPVEQHGLSPIQVLRRMVASDSSELHCEGPMYQTESK